MTDTKEVKPQTLSKQEREEAAGMIKPRAAILYEVVRREGERELVRTFEALSWSGLAAGLSLGFSPLLQAVLETYLPADGGVARLIAPFGYCTGFLIVVLARQQLFTENTITVVLPVIAEKTKTNAMRLLRLWGTVLCANLVGTFLFAAFVALSGVLPADVFSSLAHVATYMVSKSLPELFFGAIFAGWLIAAMVWLLPVCEGMEFWVIVFLTYCIALLEASHIIAGSVEAFFLVLTAQAELGPVIVDFLLPTLAGNIFGGTALFALIAYAQVREEVNGTAKN